jgi:hypothetical protein
MNASIFSTLAPNYWRAGYSVVPINPGTKKPAIAKWPGYCDNLPGAKTQAVWLETHARCGIGLLLGTQVSPGHRLIAIDIDNDQLVEPVKAILTCKSGKVGKKGITIFARAPVGEGIKAAALKGPFEANSGDLLASGRQTVVPPSTHPDTGEEYRWIGLPLLEVSFDSLPILDARLKRIIECICSSQYAPTLHDGSSTHTAAVGFVAQLVFAGATDSEITAVVQACLPTDYSGNTLSELDELISSARAKGFGSDPEEGPKANLAVQIIEGCIERGLELFRWEDEAYASFPTERGGCLTYALRSRAAERRIRHIWYDKEGRSIGPMIFSEVVMTLETKAFAGAPVMPVWNRVGSVDGEIFVDLGREDGELVRISAEGWSLGYYRHVKFRRPEGFQELPTPQSPGDFRALQRLLGLSDETFLATAAFMISAMAESGPYFGLLIEGEMGSGKSVLAETVKRLIDPNGANRLSLPTNDRDLAIQAKQFRLLSYDNTSGMKALISDALCTLATGGGLAPRKLYTDSELAVLNICRPFMLNGISGYARRPDLLERVIYVRLDRVAPEDRKEERTLKEQFTRDAPQILGGLYDALVHCLQNIKKGINPTGLRMADAAVRIAASEPAFDVPEGTLIRVIAEGQKHLVIERATTDALTEALRTTIASNPFEGTMKELHQRLLIFDKNNIPPSPTSLSIALDRQSASLLAVGIKVTMLNRGKQGRKVRVEYIGPPESAPVDNELEY